MTNPQAFLGSQPVGATRSSRPCGGLKTRARRAAAIGALASSACYSTGEGLDPPIESVYFPVGLALANGSDHLVILNSDFDLQYNAGTLQVLDLNRVRAVIPRPCDRDSDCAAEKSCDTAGSGFCVDAAGSNAGKPCGALEERPIGDKLLYPGRCQPIDPGNPPSGESFIASAVRIGAFATDVIVRDRPPDAEPGPPGRIFFPVRGDATLHWADLGSDGQVDCGQGSGSACDGAHTAGDEPDRENTRDLRLESEPFAIDATADGRSVIVTHQTSHHVSLFDNDAWSSTGPRLVDVLPGLGPRPVGVAAVPVPAVVRVRGDRYAPGFLVSFRSVPYVSLIRAVPATESNWAQQILVSAGQSPVIVNSLGTDSRGLAIDGAQRRAAEGACLKELGLDEACVDDQRCLNGLSPEKREALIPCLDRAAAHGLSVYLASRAPESLVSGRTLPTLNFASSTDLPTFNDTVRLPFGPSRVAIGRVIVGAQEGRPRFERRVFAVCFDSRRVVVYDPDRRSVDFEVSTGRGPHAVAVDEQHGLLFIGHFTDSYVGVVSIDRRYPRTYGTLIATIGNPSAPRASK